MPLIVVSPGGDAPFPFPTARLGRLPVVNNAENTTGFGYTGGSGGNGLSDNTTGVRVMDPTPARGLRPDILTDMCHTATVAGRLLTVMDRQLPGATHLLMFR